LNDVSAPGAARDGCAATLRRPPGCIPGVVEGARSLASSRRPPPANEVACNNFCCSGSGNGVDIRRRGVNHRSKVRRGNYTCQSGRHRRGWNQIFSRQPARPRASQRFALAATATTTTTTKPDSPCTARRVQKIERVPFCWNKMSYLYHTL